MVLCIVLVLKTSNVSVILRDHIEESVVGAARDGWAAQCFVNVSEALSVRANKYLQETIKIFPTSWKC